MREHASLFKYRDALYLRNQLVRTLEELHSSRLAASQCALRRGGRIKISVSDNGVGIPPENLSRIFNHGFTTKKDGHGFGLHSGALAATEMGGALHVQSDGPGCGATFTLELPCAAARCMQSETQ
jgi:signal transduction histidine kinase